MQTIRLRHDTEAGKQVDVPKTQLLSLQRYLREQGVPCEAAGRSPRSTHATIDVNDRTAPLSDLARQVGEWLKRSGLGARYSVTDHTRIEIEPEQPRPFVD